MIRRFCLVFLTLMDRGIADVHALVFQQVLEFAQAFVVFMHVADEDVGDDFLGHGNGPRKSI